MAIWDFLKLGQNLKENMPTVKATPQQVEVLQYDNDGNVDYAKTLNARQNTTPLNFNERMLGRLMSIDEQKIDPETNKTELVTHTNFKPGLLNDIGAGYRENRTTPISLDNFGENILEDGRKKGFAYKLGEGLGSFARFAESPLGRSLLMGSLVGATGGSGLQALAYGGGAGLLNQQNRMKDRIYRNSLIEQAQNSLRNQDGFNSLTEEEQQAQLDNIANQMNSIRGYVGDDTYKQVLAGMQLRDNAEYRNALLAGQRKDQEMAIQQRQAELRQKTLSDAADRALRREELDIAREKLRQNDKKNANLGNLQAVSGQLKRFEDSFASMPNKLESNTLGRLRNATGLQTKEEANFNSQRTLLFNKIARDLGGEKGVLSDQDIKRIEKSLPDYTDSMVQKQAKMQAIYDLLNDRLAVEGGSLDNTQTTTGNTTKSGVKYEVID